jgi:hypothetical protein
MSRPNRRVRELSLAVALAGSAIPAIFAAGKDDAARERAKRRPMNDTAATIDSYVYGGDESRRRELLEESLQLKINEIGKTFGLSDRDKEKLELAGKGDVGRFIRRVDQLKDKWPPDRAPEAQHNALARETWPLANALGQGLFEHDSLFFKALAATLRSDQLARYEQIGHERRRYRYQAHLELVLMQLNSFLGLSNDQRNRLANLIADKTHPIRCPDGLECRVVLAQMSRLPAENLRPLFDASQWRQLQTKLDEARRDSMWLKQWGIVFDSESKPQGKPPQP